MRNLRPDWLLFALEENATMSTILYNMQTIFEFINIFAYEGPSSLANEALFIVKLTD